VIEECAKSETHSEERWLRQCLRDLIAFTSLPLLWKDKTPRDIADDLASVLESTLASDFVLVRITGPFAEEPIDAVRTARRYHAINAYEISGRVAPFLDLECEEQALAVPNPIGPGELHITRSPVGFLNEYGVVLAGGSRVHGFPTTRDKLLMNVASNQAAALLENVALRMREREIQTLKDQLQTENIALREEIDRTYMFDEIVGSSAVLQAVLSRLSKVAPTDSAVLITGETGTGKELVARAIHRRSPRSSRAFVCVNCAAVPRDLIASELFGHEKGAFTGAAQRRLGRFELAEGGTIFLDEIGELPAEAQVTLLRVLQEHEFERVGGTQTIRTDVRLIAATNRDLEAAIAAGKFRSDLFYRLNVFPIEIPPLRERREDIPLLVEYFIDHYAKKAGKSIRGVNKKSLDLLQSYLWPGNIRELQNVIERSLIVSSGDVFSVDEAWVSEESSPRVSRVQGPPHFEGEPSGEREIIKAALAESRGRVSGPSGAAAKLRIPPSTLESKIKALKIRKSKYKFG
jgi:transcriptional regulator with GAF, ATPase, and Fis domain